MPRGRWDHPCWCPLGGLLKEGAEKFLHVVHVIIRAELDEPVRLNVLLVLVQDVGCAPRAKLLRELCDLREFGAEGVGLWV